MLFTTLRENERESFAISPFSCHAQFTSVCSKTISFFLTFFPFVFFEVMKRKDKQQQFISTEILQNIAEKETTEKTRVRVWGRDSKGGNAVEMVDIEACGEAAKDEKRPMRTSG